MTTIIQKLQLLSENLNTPEVKNMGRIREIFAEFENSIDLDNVKYEGSESATVLALRGAICEWSQFGCSSQFIPFLQKLMFMTEGSMGYPKC